MTQGTVPTSSDPDRLRQGMLARASFPRLRLNTRLSTYAQALGELLSGRWKSGDDVARLESKIQDYLGVGHAVALPMARTGIYHALKAIISPGQKVILSPYTIADVVNSVICAGGTPLFADLEKGSCNVSAQAIEELLDGDVGAVLVTHFYGEACDIERIARMCKAKKIPLIEDAAQAFSVTVGGKQLGTFGDIGIYSFGLYKNVNAFFGGMLVTNNSEIADKVRRAASVAPLESPLRLGSKILFGAITDVITWPPIFRSVTFWLFRWAYLNDVRIITHQFKIDTDPKMATRMPQAYMRRLTPLQARLALRQMNELDKAIESRIQHAIAYHNGLKDISALTLPPLKLDGSHGYYYYCIQFPDRSRLVRFAQLHGRDIQESYHRNCAALPCFNAFRRDCPNAEATADSVIYLPTYPRYPLTETAKTVAVIQKFFADGNRG